MTGRLEGHSREGYPDIAKEEAIAIPEVNRQKAQDGVQLLGHLPSHMEH